MLGLPDGFLGEDPDMWTDRDDFKTAQAIVSSLATIMLATIMQGNTALP